MGDVNNCAWCELRLHDREECRRTQERQRKFIEMVATSRPKDLSK